MRASSISISAGFIVELCLLLAPLTYITWSMVFFWYFTRFLSSVSVYSICLYFVSSRISACIYIISSPLHFLLGISVDYITLHLFTFFMNNALSRCGLSRKDNRSRTIQKSDITKLPTCTRSQLCTLQHRNIVIVPCPAQGWCRHITHHNIYFRVPSRRFGMTRHSHI